MLNPYVVKHIYENQLKIGRMWIAQQKLCYEGRPYNDSSIWGQEYREFLDRYAIYMEPSDVFGL